MCVTSAVRLVSLLLVAACATNPAPEGFLPSPGEAGRDVYGGWIEVTRSVAGHEDEVAGELIAASADTAWILPDTGRGAIVVATAAVTHGRLARYTSSAGAVAGFAALGTASTLSNGYILIFTAPAWIITGLVASAHESRAPLKDMPPVRWADLAAFARFPAGLPPGIDLAEIRPKLSNP